MKNNYFKRDGDLYWPTFTMDYQRMFEVKEEKAARFVMFQIRHSRNGLMTSKQIRFWVNHCYRTKLGDKDLRGIIRRMQIQGKPIVSTPFGFAIASKKKIEQQAVRMLKHGFSEVKYARSLLDSRLFDRITGQLKIKVKL